MPNSNKTFRHKGICVVVYSLCWACLRQMWHSFVLRRKPHLDFLSKLQAYTFPLAIHWYPFSFLSFCLTLRLCSPLRALVSSATDVRFSLLFPVRLHIFTFSSRKSFSASSSHCNVIWASDFHLLAWFKKISKPSGNFFHVCNLYNAFTCLFFLWCCLPIQGFARLLLLQTAFYNRLT
jgi:hypothetical protein